MKSVNELMMIDAARLANALVCENATIDDAFSISNDAALITTTRAVHATPAAMVAEAMRGVETRGIKRKRVLDAQAGVAIPGLSFDVVVSLVEKHLPDPADLVVLRAVSRGMRDAVDATGRKVKELVEELAVERGLGFRV